MTPSEPRRPYRVSGIGSDAPRGDGPRPDEATVEGGRPGEVVDLCAQTDGARSSSAAELERELSKLNRRSLASILRQATAVVVPRAPYYGVLAAFPLPPQSTRLWRKRARATLRLVRTDSALHPAANWVSELLVRPVDRWPSASRLAQSARRVEDSEFTRISQGYALLCEGAAGRAVNVFRGIEERVRVLRHAWRVHEGLALALELIGRTEEALATMETAAEDPRRGVSAVAEGLRLALLHGTQLQARRSAARLDMLVEERAPAFAAVFARMRLRGRILGFASPASPALAALVEELALEPGTPSGRIAGLIANGGTLRVEGRADPS